MRMRIILKSCKKINLAKKKRQRARKYIKGMIELDKLCSYTHDISKDFQKLTASI